jgi:hypothetical protein
LPKPTIFFRQQKGSRTKLGKVAFLFGSNEEVEAKRTDGGRWENNPGPNGILVREQNTDLVEVVAVELDEAIGVFTEDETRVVGASHFHEVAGEPLALPSDAGLAVG